MYLLSGITLAAIMIVTLADVIMRPFGHPIFGSYEIISFLSAIVIGFALPYASHLKAHICVDIFINRFSKSKRRIMNAITRVFVIFLFALAGWFFVVMGLSLIKTGEVSQTLRIPFYPIAFGLALSCFLICFLMFLTFINEYLRDL